MRPQIFEPLESVIGTLEMDMFEEHVLTVAEDVFGDAEHIFPESFKKSHQHFATMRSALLNSMTQGFNWSKYVGGHDIVEFNSYTPVSYSHVRRRFTLAAIASWMMSSRRVMQISEELQLLLSMTSLDNTDWSMMEWPFDSFIINLSEPIVYGAGDFKTTCESILVARESKIPGAAIMFAEANGEKPLGEQQPFSIYFLRSGFKSLAECYPISERRKILRLLKTRPDIAGNQIMKNKERKENEYRGWTSLFVSADIFKENGISKFMETCDKDKHPILTILFGSMLYMSSLQKSKRANAENSTQWVKPERSSKTTFGRQICDESLLALIGSEIKMTPDENERFRSYQNTSRKSSELSAHFRIGYFRRPPGSGNDPFAIKTVWVRPTIVRLDRLKEGALPLGAIQKT